MITLQINCKWMFRMCKFGSVHHVNGTHILSMYMVVSSDLLRINLPNLTCFCVYFMDVGSIFCSTGVRGPLQFERRNNLTLDHHSTLSLLITSGHHDQGLSNEQSHRKGIQNATKYHI